MFLQPLSIYISSESIDIYSLHFSVLRTNFKTTLRPISHHNYIAPSKYELDLPEPWNHRFLYTVCRFLLYQILGQSVLLHACYCTAFKPIHCWKESPHENMKSFLDISVTYTSSLQLWYTWLVLNLAYKNIRFSSLFAVEDVSRTKRPQRWRERRNRCFRRLFLGCTWRHQKSN